MIDYNYIRSMQKFTKGLPAMISNRKKRKTVTPIRKRSSAAIS